MHPQVDPADTDERAPRDSDDQPPVNGVLVPVHGVQQHRKRYGDSDHGVCRRHPILYGPFRL